MVERDSFGEATVLFVDDGSAFTGTFIDGLVALGWRADRPAAIREALRLAVEGSHDLVLIEWRTRTVSGAGICSALRARRPDTPIVVLTTVTDVDERVAAFGAGAADYIVKSTPVEEISRRMQTVLLRTKGSRDRYGDQAAPGEVRHGALRLDLKLQRAAIAGTSFHLTPSEVRLLARLIDGRGNFVCLHDLAYSVFEASPADVRNSIGVIVSGIRRKLRGTEVSILRKAGAYAIGPVTDCLRKNSLVNVARRI